MVNDNGGTAVDTDWTLSADGPTDGVSGVEGDPAITNAPVDPGDYTLAETGGPAGYTADRVDLPERCRGPGHRHRRHRPDRARRPPHLHHHQQ